MIKISKIVILFAVLSSSCLAQNKLTESLKAKLALAKDDTSRVLVMAELGVQYRNSNPDSCIYFSEKALEFARKINFSRGEVLALSNIGIGYREKGDLPKSLEVEFQGLRIAQKNNFIVEMAMCLRRVGLVYMDLREYRTCLNYLHQSLYHYESVNYKRGIGIENMNIGMTYEYMNKLDSALDHIKKAEELKGYIEDLYPEVERVFGNIYAKKGDPKLALFYYKKGINAGLKLNDYRTLSFIYADAARMFVHLKERDSVILYAANGVRYGQMASYKKGILFSSTILAELYDSINPREALRYYKIATAAKDSLFGAGNIKTIQTLVSKEEAQQKEMEGAKAAYQNRLKQYGLLTGFGIILIIAGILYRNNHQKQKANKILEQTLSNLKSTQTQLIHSEKMASLGELTAGIAHEIQNPLNFVNNFSELNTELIDELEREVNKGNLEDAKLLTKDIKENEQKINHHGKRAGDIVKGMLQHSRSSSGHKEPTDINLLADEYLRLAYHGLRAKDKSFNATMKTEFDENVGIVNVIPQDIGRVILNLITNAFYVVDKKKKSGVENYEPTVILITKKVDHNILISVKDNGDGIPENIKGKIFQPFFTTKPTGQGTGLGLSLSYDIVKTHGGELTVENQESEGSKFVVKLPIN